MARLLFTKPPVRPFWPEHERGNFQRCHGKMAAQIYVNVNELNLSAVMRISFRIGGVV